MDDGLATSVLPVIAALGVFADEPVALIAGGYDRGVEYAPLAEAIAARTPLTVLITMGEAGQRISEAVARRSSDVPQISVASMRAAVTEARNALSDGGVVLLSPPRRASISTRTGRNGPTTSLPLCSRWRGS